LGRLQYAQRFGTIIFVHPDYQPQTLRKKGASFDLSPFVFSSNDNTTVNIPFMKFDDAAGIKSTQVTFTTANPDDPTLDKSDKMTFSRLAPARWEFVSSNPEGGKEVLAKGQDVTITANTNLRWWGKEATTAKKYSATLTAYTTNSQVTVAAPARVVSQPASWTTPRTVTITAGYDALPPGIPALDPARTITFTQPAYYLKVTAPATSAVKSVKLTVQTDAPSYSLLLKAGSATGTKVGEVIEGTSTAPTVSLDLSRTTRVVHVVNEVTGASITTFTQPAAPLDILYMVSPPKWSANPCPTGYKLGKVGSVWYDETGGPWRGTLVRVIWYFGETYYSYRSYSDITNGVSTSGISSSIDANMGTGYGYLQCTLQ
jgi:hypothetical protein